MKTLKLSFLMLLVSIFVLSSCQNDVINPNENVIAEAQTTDFSNIRVENKSGTLHFQGDEKYFDEVETLSNLGHDQLDLWEEQLGFRSYRKMINELLHQIDAMESEGEMNAFQAQYDHLFDFSDGNISPKVDLSYYTSVANEEGIFYVGTAVFKIFEDKVVEVRDGNLEQLSRAGDLNESNDGNLFVYKVKSESLSRWCNSATYAFKAPDDRKVHVEMKLATTSCGCGTYRVRVTTKVWGQKKNVWGNWTSYKTALNFECGAYGVDINGTNYFEWGWSGQSNGDEYNIAPSRYVGPIFSNYVSANFTQAKSRASSRGVGSHWAVICCGFGSSCPPAYGYSGQDCNGN